MDWVRPRSASTLAKPKPCTNPNAKATAQRRPWTSGNKLFSAASTTDAAIADSTQREGSATQPSVARLSVIECASVKALTILTTSTEASRKLATACQCRARQAPTAGNSSDSRNKMWS